METVWITLLIIIVACHTAAAAGSKENTCDPTIETRLLLCIAPMTTALDAGTPLLQTCPDYYRARDCIYHYLLPCNSTVQEKYNATYNETVVIMESYCELYRPPASGWPTPNPNCNLTVIYDAILVCMRDVRRTLDDDYPTTLASLDHLCQEYYAAWDCSIAYVEPCPMALVYFNTSMIDIRRDFEPYCGDPDGSTGGSQFAWVYWASVLAALLVTGLGVMLAVVCCDGTVRKGLKKVCGRCQCCGKSQTLQLPTTNGDAVHPDIVTSVTSVRPHQVSVDVT